MRPTEIIFEVTEAPEGGYDARALVYSIFTQGRGLERPEGHGERCSALPLRRRQRAAGDQVASRPGGSYRGMKLPRALSGSEVARLLERHYGYRVARTKGSHMTLELTVWRPHPPRDRASAR